MGHAAAYVHMNIWGFRSKVGPWTKSQAGLGRCLEPQKNKTDSGVVIAKIC